MYTKELRCIARKCAEEIDLEINEGVYFFTSGPQFETPSEIKAIRSLGGDAVGMSTVTEAITAAHCGMKVLGLSLITNMAAGVLDQPITSTEVDDAAKEATKRFKKFIGKLLKEI